MDLQSIINLPADADKLIGDIFVDLADGDIDKPETAAEIREVVAALASTLLTGLRAQYGLVGLIVGIAAGSYLRNAAEKFIAEKTAKSPT